MAFKTRKKRGRWWQSRPRVVYGSNLTDPYRDLLNGDKPALVVTRRDDAHENFVALVCLRLNPALMSMMRMNPGDRFYWTPLWWKDNAEPYGKIRIGCTQSGQDRSTSLTSQGKSIFAISCDYTILGVAKVKLWFPVPAITHYAISKFTPRKTGVVFDPLDGFQRYHSIWSSAGINSGIEAPESMNKARLLRCSWK
jgi:hypothetical protein